MGDGEDRAEGFAADSLNGSPLKPSQSGGIHAEAGDGVASNHSLTGNRNEGEAGDGVASNRSLTGNRNEDGAGDGVAGRDRNEDDAMTQKIPGARTNPDSVPKEGHGGTNQRGNQHQQGKDGNGAQKRRQQKKS
jgi:hypothetical protein